MEYVKIQYCFILDDSTREVFDLQLNARNLEVINKENQQTPSWTALDYHQCPHCPLDRETVAHCPVATALAGVIQRFENVCSFDELELEVITSQRKVTQRTTAQRALGSFIGLLFATSGCPHTDHFKPMARFHLPLSSLEDTVYRVTSMYLMAQYFRNTEGLESNFDLTGLKKIFDNMHTLNIKITQRLRSATQTDSSLNAVIQLDSILGMMPFVSEERMNEFRYLFEVYLAEP